MAPHCQPGHLDRRRGAGLDQRHHRRQRQLHLHVHGAEHRRIDRHRGLGRRSLEDPTVLVQSGAGSIAPADPTLFNSPSSSASVSANPSVVSTNSASTDNRTEIRALFVGPGNAAIPRVRVRFDTNGDPNNIGGTFSTGTSVIYSDASGIASTAYIPGAKASPTNGVTIRACYDADDFAASAARTRRRPRSPWFPIRSR